MVRRILTGGLTVLLLATAAIEVSPAAADTSDPRHRSGEVAGLRYEVLLPPSYDAAPARRYPVLYLFPPGGNTPEDWFTRSDLEDLADDVIVVIPDGGVLGLFVDGRDGGCRGETQVIDHLIPAVDASYRTIADGRHRAIAGASTSAFSAMHLAARHPGRFVAAGSFDGPPDSTFGMGALGIPVFFLVVERYGIYEDCGSSLTGPGLWGYPATDEVWWRDANPADLAGNLRGLGVYVAVGDGRPCDPQDLATLFEPQQETPPGTGPVFQLSGPYEATSSRAFVAALERGQVAHTADVHRCGLHSWRYWARELRAFWEVMTAAFGAPEPATLDHRRAASRFSAWRWNFQADPGRAAEFLDVRRASRDGFTLAGSGLTTVTTAPYFSPHQPVDVRVGTATRRMFADSAGRLRLVIDLGSPHRSQQFTPAARLEAALPGDYFTTRTVELEPVP